MANSASLSSRASASFKIATLERRGRLRFSIPVMEWLANVRRLPEYRIEPLTDDIAERAGLLGESSPAITRTG